MAGKSKNNFRDALSLALIKDGIDVFKKNKKASFPIFYASTNVIRSIRKNPAIYKEFDVQIKFKKETKRGKRRVNTRLLPDLDSFGSKMADLNQKGFFLN